MQLKLENYYFLLKQGKININCSRYRNVTSDYRLISHYTTSYNLFTERTACASGYQRAFSIALPINAEEVRLSSYCRPSEFIHYGVETENWVLRSHVESIFTMLLRAMYIILLGLSPWCSGAGSVK
jgi:hypothetical protein